MSQPEGDSTLSGPGSRGLKILHVAETAQGGVGSYIEEIAPLQAGLYGERKVRVVMPAEHASHFRKLDRVALHTFPTEGVGRLRAMLRMTAMTLKLVRQWRPDVVHLHSTYAGFALRPLLALLPRGPRVVYCAHGWAFDREGSGRANAALQAVERIWSRWCDAVICISRHDFDSGLRAGIAARRMVIVMNGVADAPGQDVADEPWPNDGLRILFVGRLDRQKGVDVLYEALRRLGPRASALVVGSAVVAGERGATAPDNVRVLGWLPRERIDAYYRAAQVLVVPSRWEGFGLVALEAMRAGRAVIASHVGGLPEVVEDGVTGLLFEPGLGPRPAAELAGLLDGMSGERLQAMGEAGRLRFERLFHIRRVGAELDGLYQQLLEPVGVKAVPLA
ncbi:MAG: glycosyltransferase family 1 protein [Aquabacterium sp.]|nr:MAG: glycosyltransferase family 1 protein [Aquabacterium sp.]